MWVCVWVGVREVGREVGRVYSWEGGRERERKEERGTTHIEWSLSCSSCRKSVETSLALSQMFEAVIMRELYPQSKIDIYVQVLQSDGGRYMICTYTPTV